MVVGICRIGLHFGESRSLKDKRRDLRRLIDRVRAKFNAAVAEVADQEVWQRATIGICVVGNEGQHVQAMLDRVLGFVEESYIAPVVQRETELMHFGEAHALGLKRTR